MEVGEQGIHDPEPPTRIEEQVGVAGAGCEGAIGGGTGLQRAGGGGAHGDNPAAPVTGGLNLPRHLRGQVVVLDVHPVLLHVLDADRQERARPHVKGDLGNLDIPGTQGLEDRRSKVQSRRRRRHRPRLLGERGLVAQAVGPAQVGRQVIGPVDIGRQRRPAHLFEGLRQVDSSRCWCQAELQDTTRCLVEDLHLQRTALQGHALAGPELAGRVHVTPGQLSLPGQDQHLYPPTATPLAHHAPRQNHGIVENQEISRRQELR